MRILEIRGLPRGSSTLVKGVYFIFHLVNVLGSLSLYDEKTLLENYHFFNNDIKGRSTSIGIMKVSIRFVE